MAAVTESIQVWNHRNFPEELVILVVALNLGAIFMAVFSENELLMQSSYLFYGFQLATLIPCVLSQTKFLKDVFLPSTFMLFYFCINLAFGAYLVPRGYGWNKEFTETVSRIQNYGLIVPYLMLCNVALFCISIKSLMVLNARGARYVAELRVAFDKRYFVQRSLLFFFLFILVGVLDVYSAFSFQLGVLIVHLSDPSLRSRKLRYPIYLLYLFAITALSFDNKREVAMCLFFIVFIEAYFEKIRLEFGIGNMLRYSLVLGLFLMLIISASVLRGYGDYSATGIFDLLATAYAYIGSDIFIDGITDNLELNYFYGVAVTSIDYVLRGQMDYQFGASIIKPFFLPFPRELFTWKPESVLQIFTQAYAPGWWYEGGSMPVSFAAEMFVNFHLVGVLVLVAVLIYLNYLYTRSFPDGSTFSGYSMSFFTVTILILARGGGLEQYLLYYFVSVVIFILFYFIRVLSRESAKKSMGQCE